MFYFLYLLLLVNPIYCMILSISFILLLLQADVRKERARGGDGQCTFKCKFKV